MRVRLRGPQPHRRVPRQAPGDVERVQLAAARHLLELVDHVDRRPVARRAVEDQREPGRGGGREPLRQVAADQVALVPPGAVDAASAVGQGRAAWRGPGGGPGRHGAGYGQVGRRPGEAARIHDRAVDHVAQPACPPGHLEQAHDVVEPASGFPRGRLRQQVQDRGKIGVEALEAGRRLQQQFHHRPAPVVAQQVLEPVPGLLVAAGRDQEPGEELADRRVARPARQVPGAGLADQVGAPQLVGAARQLDMADVPVRVDPRDPPPALERVLPVAAAHRHVREPGQRVAALELPGRRVGEVALGLGDADGVRQRVAEQDRGPLVVRMQVEEEAQATHRLGKVAALERDVGIGAGRLGRPPVPGDVVAHQPVRLVGRSRHRGQHGVPRRVPAAVRPPAPQPAADQPRPVELVVGAVGLDQRVDGVQAVVAPPGLEGEAACRRQVVHPQRRLEAPAQEAGLRRVEPVHALAQRQDLAPPREAFVQVGGQPQEGQLVGALPQRRLQRRQAGGLVALEQHRGHLERGRRIIRRRGAERAQERNRGGRIAHPHGLGVHHREPRLVHDLRLEPLEQQQRVLGAVRTVDPDRRHGRVQQGVRQLLGRRTAGRRQRRLLPGFQGLFPPAHALEHAGDPGIGLDRVRVDRGGGAERRDRRVVLSELVEHVAQLQPGVEQARLAAGHLLPQLARRGPVLALLRLAGLDHQPVDAVPVAPVEVPRRVQPFNPAQGTACADGAAGRRARSARPGTGGGWWRPSCSAAGRSVAARSG